ncbi:MAG: aldehyde dehydrogenase family protein, partial [Candidatus Obscuribacterales bacterium]|nr:aldehyde dehydrogenase family protein [Candidatus Obscuribacterales bacterium]
LRVGCRALVSDVSRAHKVAAQLDAGMVFINRFGCYDFASPSGGFKQSGWGKEMAVHSLSAYTKLKSVWLKLKLQAKDNFGLRFSRLP